MATGGAGDPTGGPGGTREQQAKGAKAKRQRRLLMAAGAAVVLALIFLLQRGGGGEAPAEAAADPEAGAGAGGDTAPPFGSTFADNGEAAGALGTSITEGLAEVAAGLEGVNASLLDLSDGQTSQGDTQPVAPQGPTNITINTGTGRAAKQARSARSSPAKTSSHAAAGLHRIGGNTYVDRKTGKTFHRVGKGKQSHFAPGKPGKPKPKPKPQHKAKPNVHPPGVHGHKPAGRPGAKPKPKPKPRRR